jgi:hypothetical protein
MSSNPELVVLNGYNYGIWAQDMETPLMSKVSCQFTKTLVPKLKDGQQKFVIDEREDEVVGVITTYISREI